jgi:aspartate/methionine/tyrosine aminotransferase
MPGIKRVSERLARIPPSATLGISARARELRAEGKDVISFGAGEPDFPTPEHVLAETARAVHDPENHKYTASAGLRPLREAIAEDVGLYSRVKVDWSEVMVTNGAKQAVFQAFAALLDPGDEVLLPSPHWVTYPAGIDLAGATTVSVPTRLEDEFKVTVDDLERARTDRTRLLVFVSPSNPTGAVYTEEEARAIGEWAAANGIWVMADEIYQRLTYFTDVAPSIASVTPRFENWVLINGVAKTYSMTGWRVGWMVGPADIVEAANAHQSHATGNVDNVAQIAALTALRGPQDTVEEMRQAFDNRRKLMLSLVNDLPGVRCVEPQGAFYVFPDVTDAMKGRWESSDALATAILEEAGVALVPGESFGTPGYLRLSYATGEAEIERGMDRIRRLLAG